MLQRIQTIWLFLAAVCTFAGLKLPFYTGNGPMLEGYHALTGTSGINLMILTIGIGVIALINIFLYSNRKLQFRLCLLGILLEIVLIYLYYNIASNYAEGTYALSAALQLFIILFFALAARGIKHDDKIVKESNRLR